MVGSPCCLECSRLHIDAHCREDAVKAASIKCMGLQAGGYLLLAWLQMDRGRTVASVGCNGFAGLMGGSLPLHDTILT
jgi:hypothetical protein